MAMLAKLALDRNRKILAVVLVLLVVAGAAVAAFGGDGELGAGDDATKSQLSRTRNGASDEGERFAAGAAATAAGPGGTADVDLAAKAVPTVAPNGPRVVKTAELRVKVKRDGFTNAFDEVASIAARHGGFVADSSTSIRDDAASGRVTVRVPVAAFDAARRELRALGSVEGESLRGEDVSAQLVDLDARIRSLQAQEEALRALLGKANTVGEVIQVQDHLFQTRTQIEQLQAQRAHLDDAAALATLSVSLFEPGAASRNSNPEPTSGLAHDLDRAVDAAVAVVGGMLITIGAVTPLTVLALVAWLLSRGVRRRRQSVAAAA